jgi:hypothetical protein
MGTAPGRFIAYIFRIPDERNLNDPREQKEEKNVWKLLQEKLYS